MLLSQCQVGWEGHIKSLRSEPPSPESEALVQRLAALGLTPDTPIKVTNRGPVGGNPMVIEVRGSLLGLRKEEAGYIEVN